MLTRKQRDLLLFIHDHMTDDDVAPSFEEMKEALGLKSKSGIHRLITGLVERGYIERLPHRARALAIKRLPDGMKSNKTTGASAPATPKNIRPMPVNDTAFNTIPLYGQIAAGTPIEAIAN